MKISYGITVHNEQEELERLLGKLLVSIDEEDEVVICVDGNHEGVRKMLSNYIQLIVGLYIMIESLMVTSQTTRIL